MKKGRQVDGIKVLGNPARIIGLLALVLLLAGSCTGKGCSCKGCGKDGADSGKSGPGADGGKVVKSGSTADKAPGGDAAKPGGTSPDSGGDKTATGGPGQDKTKSGPTTLPGADKPRPGDPADPKQKEKLKDMILEGDGANPPAAPTGLAAMAVDGVNVALTWNDVSNEEYEYQVDRANESMAFSVAHRLGANSQTVVDGPLDPGTYEYRVRAIGAGGASPFSGPVSVTLEGAGDPPEAPTGLSAAPDPSMRVYLAWKDNADDETYFRIEREDEQGEYIDLAMLGPNVETYEDNIVEGGKTYSYKLYAGNEAGESGPAGPVSADLEEVEEPPAAPTGLAFDVISPMKAELRWKDESDNETSFIVQEKKSGFAGFVPIDETEADEDSITLTALTPGKSYTMRVIARNAAGDSEPSNEVTFQTQGSGSLANAVITVSPDGTLTIDNQVGQGAPALELIESSASGGGVTARIAVTNADPTVQLENVYVVIEDSSEEGVTLQGCDRGPDSCSVGEGASNNDPVGYQYVEGGEKGQAPLGGEMLDFGKMTNATWAVRDIWPTCGQVGVEWNIQGLGGQTELAAAIFGEKVPADFRLDARYNKDNSLFLVEAYTIGVDAGDGYHEPGSRNNPTARPVTSLNKGDLFAVNVSIEAGDWMERQGNMGRYLPAPNADYKYWKRIPFAVTYDPAVVRPISSNKTTPEGVKVTPGILDPIKAPNQLDDGFLITWQNKHDDLGYMGVFTEYTKFTFDEGEDGNTVCGHCGQEGFVNAAGVSQGPDADVETTLAVIYFEVIGEAGTGTAIRIAPRPHTGFQLYKTNGTIKDGDDQEVNDVYLEVNPSLPPTISLEGDQQVNETYICVQ